MLFSEREIPENIKTYKILTWDRIKNIRASQVRLMEKNGKVTDQLYNQYMEIAYRMAKTCMLEDGVGIAAPQVGIFKNIILIKNIIDMPGDENSFTDDTNMYRMLLNPGYKGIAENGKNEEMEYCLSVPGKGYKIERFSSIEVGWFEITKEKEIRERKVNVHDYLARVIQHENDHLIGISIPQRWKLQNKIKSKKLKK